MLGRRSKSWQTFAKNVLQLADRTTEQAAWEVLYALGELLPKKLEELRSISRQLTPGPEEDIDSRNLTRQIQLWAWKKKFPSRAVEEAGCKSEWETNGPAIGLVAGRMSNRGDFVFDEPSITAYPFNETRTAFLK